MSITLEHVKKSFGAHTVLHDVHFVLPDTGAVCFFGPSGCGKTTLLRLICGLDQPDAGVIRVSAGTRFACHFQEDRLLPWYTAEENISLALGGVEQARTWLARMQLSQAGGLYPDELSGGMRRRVSLARALGYPAEVLALDEPLRELDAPTCDAMLEWIKQSARGRLLILITHERVQIGRAHV